jgi:hypothetical protein
VKKICDGGAVHVPATANILRDRSLHVRPWKKSWVEFDHSVGEDKVAYSNPPCCPTLNIILPLQNVPVNLTSLELAPTYTLNVPAGTFHA